MYVLEDLCTHYKADKALFGVQATVLANEPNDVLITTFAILQFLYGMQNILTQTTLALVSCIQNQIVSVSNLFALVKWVRPRTQSFPEVKPIEVVIRMQ